MKKSLLIALAMLIGSIGIAQTTAINFNCNDCNGSNHDLFTELNAGKVIVLVWVMPCSACISASRTAYDDVQTYSATNPGRVLFYLADDYANTSCSTLSAWGNTNSMPDAVVFSNTAINPANYGNVGMPKIVILGGTSHTVFYNEDNGANLSGINPAIDQAMVAAGIEENSNTVSEVNLYTDFANNTATLFYDLNTENSVNIDIFDITGKKINTISISNQAAGKHEVQIDMENLNSGLYFLKLNTSGFSKVVKFVVTE
jgi:hypothetical protein